MGRPARRRAAPLTAACPADLEGLLGELDVPDIAADLADVQTDAGAVFGEDGVPVTYNNDRQALEAARQGVCIIDRSHWGRLRLSGPGRAAFLHGQSTNDIAALAPGRGCDTALVTAQARCLDLATCLMQGSGVLLIVSPGQGALLAQRLDKFVFPGDEVAVQDVGAQTVQLSLLGPGADELMQGLQAGALVGQSPGSHTVFGFGGRPVVAAVGGGLSGPGYTLIADEAVAADLWAALTGRGAVPMGTAAWEVARVVDGRPAPGAELTEEYNPLEAGLYHAVSLSKGCYIGQETLAKVHTKGALRRQLWGLELDAPCAVGDEVRPPPPPKPLPTLAEALEQAAAAATGNDPAPAVSAPVVDEQDAAAAPQRALGTVTSFVDLPQGGGHRALAYLRCKVGGKLVDLEGAKVEVGGVAARVVALPFASRTFAAGAGGVGGGADEEEAQRQKEAEEAAEAERRAEKLKAMQERLAAWQATQGGS